MFGKVILVLIAAAASVSCSGFQSVIEAGLVGLRDAYPQCAEDLLLVLEGLNRSEIWAWKMLDASTKIPVGLVTGNLVDYGNYDECVGIRTNDTPIGAQHCMATIKPPLEEDDSALKIPIVYRWSYCVPDTCPPSALEAILTRAFSMFTPNRSAVTVLPTDCQTGDSKPLIFTDMLGISVWSAFALVAVASTVYEATLKLQKRKTNPWLVSFSLYTNIDRLFDTKVAEDTLTPLNGLRFLSIAWIILGHRYYFMSLTSVMNMIEVPQEFEKIYFQIFAGGVLAVDTFFLLSGLLNSYLLTKHMEDAKKFPFCKFYLHRYFRTTPALAAIVLMYSTWFVLLGDGPGWNRMTSFSKQLCEDYWWPTLLYINNYYNSTMQCAGQSWYLAVDMQLYWLSPLIILPVWKNPKLGKYYLSFLLLLSAVAQFVVAYIYKFRMAFSISLDPDESTKLTELLYVPTHTRATPYIIGIMLGMRLRKLRDLQEPPRIPKVLVVFGWMLSTTVCLSVLFGNFPFFRSPENHPYDRFESSFYIGLHRIGWGFGISWIIFACSMGYGGVVNSILSWKAFVPLSRLTYCLFLCHMAVQQYMMGTARVVSYFRILDEIHGFFGDLFLSIFAALLLTLLFESPFSVIERLILKREPTRNQRKQRNQQAERNQSYINNGFQDA